MQVPRTENGCSYDLPFWKLPDSERVLPKNQFAISRRVEVERFDEFQFFVHGKLPTRLGIASAPYELPGTELLVGCLEERNRVPIRILFADRQFVWFRSAHPYLGELFQPEHFAKLRPWISSFQIGLTQVVD